jgi:hypothetical protein
MALNMFIKIPKILLKVVKKQANFEKEIYFVAPSRFFQIKKILVNGRKNSKKDFQNQLRNFSFKNNIKLNLIKNLRL